ncbi:MAG: prepilin-type N-terminal cleavage/methylation domain-containing protein [Lentisphaeraceae bacterium]|nr:prepilin-type N-terminal cleavage/methylation domain-containing protein [Lentisphaeraceae bacterium]
MVKKFNFTLIEVMIAIGIFAILAVSCVSLMSSMASSLQVQQERSAHVDSLVRLDKTVKKMFTNMVQFTWRDQDNERLPHFLGLYDSIRFTYLNRVNNMQDGGLRFAEIYIDEEARLVARYQNRPYRNAEEMNEDAYFSVLSEEVESISFNYASVEEDKTSSEELEWLEEWSDERLDIPLAVMFTVKWTEESGKGEETFLWRTAGNSYFERWGAWRNGESISR